MTQFLTASLAILALMAGWVLVQHLARAFAARHPELGPCREEGGGCHSGACGACSTACGPAGRSMNRRGALGPPDCAGTSAPVR